MERMRTININKRSCMVCGGGLTGNLSSITHANGLDGLVYQYHCEGQMCQLKPYTRYLIRCLNEVSCLFSSIIVDIDNKHYMLAFDIEKNETFIGLIKDFLNEDDPKNSYVYSSICKLNYIESWYDLDSAVKVVSRVLKIKAFS